LIFAPWAPLYRFVLENPAPVLAAGALYGVVFAVQSLMTAYAGAYAPGAAPAAIAFMAVAFGAFVIGWASLGRLALGIPKKGFYGLTLGGDEGRLIWALALVVLLLVIILMTAGVAMAFMIAGLAFTEMDPGAPQPDGYVNLFEMMGPVALAVSFALIAVFRGVQPVADHTARTDGSGDFGSGRHPGAVHLAGVTRAQCRDRADGDGEPCARSSSCWRC
jgi:hypothetical protein